MIPSVPDYGSIHPCPAMLPGGPTSSFNMSDAAPIMLLILAVMVIARSKLIKRSQPRRRFGISLIIATALAQATLPILQVWNAASTDICAQPYSESASQAIRHYPGWLVVGIAAVVLTLLTLRLKTNRWLYAVLTISLGATAAVHLHYLLTLKDAYFLFDNFWTFAPAAIWIAPLVATAVMRSGKLDHKEADTAPTIQTIRV
jgi:hypothetical protein